MDNTIITDDVRVMEVVPLLTDFLYEKPIGEAKVYTDNKGGISVDIDISSEFYKAIIKHYEWVCEISYFNEDVRAVNLILRGPNK